MKYQPTGTGGFAQRCNGTCRRSADRGEVPLHRGELSGWRRFLAATLLVNSFQHVQGAGGNSERAWACMLGMLGSAVCIVFLFFWVACFLRIYHGSSRLQAFSSPKLSQNTFQKAVVFEISMSFGWCLGAPLVLLPVGYARNWAVKSLIWRCPSRQWHAHHAMHERRAVGTMF